MSMRLVIVATHPIQYYAPWFAHIAAQPGVDLQVLYLWDAGAKQTRDAGFGQSVQWDVPLLEGYPHRFLRNASRTPGTGSLRGLQNPALLDDARALAPDAVLLTTYAQQSPLEFILRWPRTAAPLVFRGDSHRLTPRPETMREWGKKQLIRRVFSRFAAVLSVGTANRAYFREHGVPEERIFRSPHAVDGERLRRALPQADADAAEWRRSLGIAGGNGVLLYLGKWTPQKGVHHLIEAFRAAAVEGWTLLIAGAGEEEARLRQLASGAADIVFAPFQNQSQIPRTIRASDVVVLPSATDETWGLVVNEAMDLGRPVIVSDVVGCHPDLVIPGETGWVFPHGAVGALRESLRNATASRAALQKMGTRAAEHIRGWSYAAATDGLLQALTFLRSGRAAR